MIEIRGKFYFVQLFLPLRNIKFNGDMRFNIIIRSILNYKNISEISVASGVVIDSNAKHEFNENYLKAKALIDLFK